MNLFSNDIFGSEQNYANQQHETVQQAAASSHEPAPQQDARRECGCSCAQPRRKKTWRERWDSFRLCVAEAAPVVQRIASAAIAFFGAVSAFLGTRARRKKSCAVPV